MVRLGAGDGASERRGAVRMGEEDDSVMGEGTVGAGVACTAVVMREGGVGDTAWSDVYSTFDSANSSC
jgi:hypothetical protein